MHRPLAAATVLMTVVLAMPVTAQQSSGAPVGNAETGKRLFVADGCYECHGREAQGGAAGPRLGPPRIPFEALKIYVRHPTGAMPPYTAKVISDAQLNDIYAFLKTIPTPPAVKTIPLLNH
jgi:mono/diheme cytochrome c family protein